MSSKLLWGFSCKMKFQAPHVSTGLGSSTVDLRYTLAKAVLLSPSGPTAGFAERDGTYACCGPNYGCAMMTCTKVQAMCRCRGMCMHGARLVWRRGVLMRCADDACAGWSPIMLTKTGPETQATRSCGVCTCMLQACFGTKHCVHRQHRPLI